VSTEQIFPSDEILVRQCLAGNPAAWNFLYRHYHDQLVRAGARLLGARSRDTELADEIAARVWCSLVFQNSHRLRAFDPARGRLSAYLAALVRQEVQHYYRPRRPGARQLPLVEGQAVQPPPDVPESGQRDEFLATLTGQEQRFFLEHLMARGEDAPPPRPLSPANYRKLKQRVLYKLHQFLRRE
jgi:DNA-directed RNA polymerase specialized sigma24 family protein